MDYSMYSVVFDRSSPAWTDDRDYNLMYILNAKNFYNSKLVMNGYVFLRDILETLGLKITKASCLVGWRRDLENVCIDNYIEFMIDENEEGPDIRIDFNVDGSIIDYFD